MATASASPLGNLLKQWRQARRVSQLDLALDANVSARHIRFLETGRSRPSPEMVLQLAQALDVPLRDQNDLLRAAGFAPRHLERGLDQPELSSAARALDHILSAHEPHGAMVVDGHWNMVKANNAMQRLMGLILTPSAAPPIGPPNVYRLLFQDQGLRRHIKNFDHIAHHLISRLAREVRGRPFDEDLAALLGEVRDLAGAIGAMPHDLDAAPEPFVTMDMEVGGARIRLFSTITTFGTAQDITLQELKIETFHPADEQSEAVLLGLLADT